MNFFIEEKICIFIVVIEFIFAPEGFFGEGFYIEIGDDAIVKLNPLSIRIFNDGIIVA